jgi:hypothetical protein
MKTDSNIIPDCDEVAARVVVEQDVIGRIFDELLAEMKMPRSIFGASEVKSMSPSTTTSVPVLLYEFERCAPENECEIDGDDGKNLEVLMPQREYGDKCLPWRDALFPEFEAKSI